MFQTERKPPPLAEWFLRSISRPEDQYAVIGDFEEIYREIVENDGLQEANRWYWIQVFRSAPLLLTNCIYWRFVMFKNYVKVALRNLGKHKGYTFVNITGLAIGMAVCVIILLFVREESSYDDYHVYKDRIYRVQREFLDTDGSVSWYLSSLAPSFVHFMELDFPEFEHIARMFNSGKTTIHYKDQTFIEELIFFAEEDIFEILTLPLVKGDATTALQEPGTIVVTESVARKYFGDENPLGKELEVRSQYTARVTGVMKDIPKKSHFHFDALISYNTLAQQDENTRNYFFGTTNFSDNVCRVYARLAPGVDPAGVEAKIPSFLDERVGSRQDGDGNTVLARDRIRLKLMKVTDIHLYSATENEVEANGDVLYVTIFTIIALFILLIACINFINLSTARAARRAKEVGLRKVVGANRQILVTQFIGESLLIALLSMLVAIILIQITLPYVNTFSGLELDLRPFINPFDLLTLLGVFVLAGIVAGLYPAFYLSAFKPATILRGELVSGSRGTQMRKFMVVFQFAVSTLLIICVGVISRQMHFIKSTDLGFDRENIVLIPADNVIRDRWTDVKHNLLRDSHILAATVSKRAPTGILADSPGFTTEVNGQVLNGNIFMPHNRTEHDFFRTYGIDMVAGRDFSVDHPTDSLQAFILNETAVQQLGWANAEDAVGAAMSIGGRNGQVIGVARDFHYESLHKPIVPVVTYVRIPEINTAALRLAPGDPREALEYAQTVWNQYHPGMPLEYTFLDQRLDQLYSNETRMMEMFGYFSLLAVFVACLGLFGLATFMTEQRTKEIGIRKVMGASVAGIIRLLSREFAKWVLLANLIAWPTAYVAMYFWMQNFAYRANMGVELFLAASFIALFIALLTVSYQSFKAACTNPVDALKYE